MSVQPLAQTLLQMVPYSFEDMHVTELNLLLGTPQTEAFTPQYY